MRAADLKVLAEQPRHLLCVTSVSFISESVVMSAAADSMCFVGPVTSPSRKLATALAILVVVVLLALAGYFLLKLRL